MSRLEITMFCPRCRGEYREGIVECPACREVLTSELSTAPVPTSVQRLPTAANLAIIGTGLIFLIRTVGTFHTSRDLMAARGLSAVYCLSLVAIAVFFLVFLVEGVERAQWRLRLGTWTALAGSIASAAIVAMNLLLLFDRPVVSGHQLGVASNTVSMLVPVTSVLFFAALWVENRSASPRMETAVRLALVGAILSAGAHGVTVAVGLLYGGLAGARIVLLLAGTPIIIYAVGTWFYFLWIVRQEQLRR